MDFFRNLSASFYSKSFYQQKTAQATLGKSFLYLLFFGLIEMLLALVLMVSVFIPRSQVFMTWLTAELPTIQITQSGLVMQNPSPYTMQDQKGNPVATIDLSKESIEPDTTMGQEKLYLTGKMIYERKENGEIQMVSGPFETRSKGRLIKIDYNLTKKEITPEEMKDVDMFVTSHQIYTRKEGEDVKSRTWYEAWQDLKKDVPELDNEPTLQYLMQLGWEKVRPYTTHPITIGVVLFLSLILVAVSFIGKILIMLIYALIGLIFNSMRSHKLEFGKIYPLMAYALTPLFVLEVIQDYKWLFGFQIPFSFFINVGVALFYLYFSLKMSEVSTESKNSVA